MPALQQGPVGSGMVLMTAVSTRWSSHDTPLRAHSSISMHFQVTAKQPQVQVEQAMAGCFHLGISVPLQDLACMLDSQLVNDHLQTQEPELASITYRTVDCYFRLGGLVRMYRGLVGQCLILCFQLPARWGQVRSGCTGPPMIAGPDESAPMLALVGLDLKW